MAKFRYRMQNILNIKMKLEAQAEIVYSTANAAYMEEQRKLQNLLVRRTGYERKLKELMDGEIDVQKVNHAREDVNTMKTIVRRQMMEVHKAEKKLESARRELSQVMMERKTQEKLREKAFDHFKRELATAENKEIDELVSYTFNGK